MTDGPGNRAIFVRNDLERTFGRAGYLVVDLLDEREVAALLAVYRKHARHHGQGFSPSILSPDLSYRRRVDEEVAAVIGARVRELLRHYRLIHAGFAVKSANSPDSAMVLHQDMTFVEESGPTSLSIWCPLVDVGPRNGCLQLVPGSFRCNPNLRPPVPLPYQDLVPVIREKHLVNMSLRAGQAIVMHPRTFHCSPANRGDADRVVAVAVATAAESRLLYCHGPCGSTGGDLELFAVDEGFYRVHAIGSHPRAGARPLGRRPYVTEQLTAECLAGRVAGAFPTGHTGEASTGR